MRHINIRELAKELKLSVSTISKVFSNSHEISEETRRRVIETAARLNYIPNANASSLRRKKSMNIGVVIPEVADSFFSLAINGIESVAKENGYHVLIYLTHESFENEKNILKECQGGRVDGILISVSRETAQSDHINELISNGVPLIFFDRVCEDVETAKITTDDLESSYNATTHLIQQGCSHIAFLSISNSLSITSKRLKGYLQAHTDLKLKVDKEKIVLCTNDAVRNYSLIRKLLQSKNRPDGIVVSVEKLTTPVYKACDELNLRIPQDLKVICFSNLETASILNPSLSTITQPAYEMGMMAAQILFKALQKQNLNLIRESLVIPSSLDARRSTGKTDIAS